MWGHWWKCMVVHKWHVKVKVNHMGKNGMCIFKVLAYWQGLKL